MKKVCRTALALALACCLTFGTAPLAAGAEVTVRTDNAEVQWTDAEPVIDAAGRTLVPLRPIADALGLTVEWDAESRTAAFADAERRLCFTIDSAAAVLESGEGEPERIEMDTAAVIIDERTYAPVRYLAESFGYAVGWDDATRTVFVSPAGQEYEIVYRAGGETRLLTDGSYYIRSESEFNAVGDEVLRRYYDADGALISYREWVYEEDYYSYTEYDADGTMRSRRESTYDAAGNLLSSKWYTPEHVNEHVEFVYDEAGNQIKRISYNADGSVHRTIEYIYAAGELVECVTRNADGTVFDSFSHMYYYNDDGTSMIARTDYYPDGSIELVTETSYDAGGRELRTAKFYGDGSAYYGWEYTYDAAGNVLSYSEFDSDGAVGHREEFSYDESGNRLEWITYYPNGWISGRIAYTYDERGNLLSEDTYFEDGTEPVSSLKMEYDADGNLTARHHYGGEGEDSTSYTFDGHGSILSYTWYDENGVLIAYSDYVHTYDSAGNLTSTTEYNIEGSAVTQYEYSYIALLIPIS